MKIRAVVSEKALGRLWLALVFMFLYIPLIFLVVFSFNSTRQALGHERAL